MTLLTPPPTAHKPKSKKSKTGLWYYEDLYGLRNYDEQFDRHADACEEESDSEPVDTTNPTRGSGFSRPHAADPELRRPMKGQSHTSRVQETKGEGTMRTSLHRL